MWNVLLSAVLVLLLTASNGAAAEYRLSSGDVLELSVVGIPELRQKAVVDIDGNVIIPLVGPIPAAGLTLSEASQALKNALSRDVFQQRASDGRSYPIAISQKEVTVSIAEYRPVYIKGDVAEAGEQPYRPRMTARQAISVAGGYGGSHSPLEASRLRSEVETLWIQWAKDRAALWRLESELAPAKQLPFPDFSELPLSRDNLQKIKETETDQLKTRQADLDKEKASIRNSIMQADKRLGLLANQMKNEEEASRADAADFERVSNLFEKGNIAVTRVSDARKTMLLSATRILQTSAAAAQLEREREGLRRSLEGLDDKRRIQVTAEWQEVSSRLSQNRSKRDSIQEQLGLSGGNRIRPELAVVRSTTSGRRERIAADEDAELLPGDVLEVTFKFDQLSQVSR